MAQYVGITADERNMAALAHGLAIVFGFLGPLLIMLIKGEQSQFVKDQSKEALNFSITIAIAAFVSFLLCFVLIGFRAAPHGGHRRFRSPHRRSSRCKSRRVVPVPVDLASSVDALPRCWRAQVCPVARVG
jgi:hypothetical protein